MIRLTLTMLMVLTMSMMRMMTYTLLLPLLLLPLLLPRLHSPPLPGYMMSPKGGTLIPLPKYCEAKSKSMRSVFVKAPRLLGAAPGARLVCARAPMVVPIFRRSK